MKIIKPIACLHSGEEIDFSIPSYRPGQYDGVPGTLFFGYDVQAANVVERNNYGTELVETTQLQGNSTIDLYQEKILDSWDKEEEVEQTIGVPFLSEIPVLKYFFGTTTTSVEKNNVYLTVQANIGIAPWECLSMAISGKVGLSFGFVHTVSGIIILGIDLLLKEKIGFGTILDALLVGNYVDWISYFHPIPVSRNLCLSIILVIVGLFVMGFGQYFYMSAGQSCGPRDSLTIALGKRFPNHPVGLVQSVIVGVVLLIGWVLDGPIGIGTVISVFVAGTALQIVCRIMHFEPRNVKHLNLLEATKLLLSH